MNKIYPHDIISSGFLFFILGNSVFYLEEWPAVHLIFSFLRLIAVIYILMRMLKQRVVGKFTYLVLFFYTILGGITIIKHAAVNVWLSYMLNSFAICALLYIEIIESKEHAIKIFADTFAALIYLNFLTLVINPDGIIGGAYLIGRNYNQMGMTIVCGMVTNIIAYNMKVKHIIPTIILSVVGVISPLIVGSMTSTIGTLLIFAFFFVPNNKIKKIILISLFVFYLLFQSFAIFLQNDISNINLIVNLVENVMGKNLTFSDRTRVWLESYYYITQSPYIGYGIRDSDWFAELFDVRSAHNIILQILIYGGFTLLTAFIIIIFCAIIRSYRKATKIDYTSLFGLCTAFMMMMMENYSLILIMYLIAIVYYSKELSQPNKSEQLLLKQT